MTPLHSLTTQDSTTQDSALHNSTPPNSTLYDSTPYDSTPDSAFRDLTLQDLTFERPAALQATRPPERRGSGRDDVRLLVSTPAGHTHAHFTNLELFLRSGDLLVVNDSATLPSSLSAQGAFGPFRLNLSTRYGANLWLAEPRWSASTPGPLPLQVGDAFTVAGVSARALAPHPELPRLWFVQFHGDLQVAMNRHGTPIRYGYVPEAFGLDSYQTVFAKRPGSAEMPSAARPFSLETVKTLRQTGVEFATVTLHTGVSSLEVEADLDHHSLYAEPFEVSAAARQLNAARAAGRRIIAVGTTVVRALESALEDTQFVAMTGFTRKFVRPGSYAGTVDGLITGFHDPRASHLAMLYAVAGRDLVRSGYAEAVQRGYLWHEFGDSHLLLTR